MSESKFPSYVNGEPPVLTLLQYDSAEWMNETCIDYNVVEKIYYVVLFDKPETKIAKIDKLDNDKLDLIFQDAKLKMPK